VASLKGRLLVAALVLADPNFHRTVVLVLEHLDDDGAVGVVLNRPTDVLVHAALPDWDRVAAAPSVVFVGGPVAEGSALCLGRLPGAEAVEVVDLERDPDDVAAEQIRLFVGYAGWGPGQLEDEIEEGAWFVVDAHPDDPLSDDPEGLWTRVLRRQRGHLRLLALYPPSPSVN
jgi:putative transcriptional regulator